MTKDQNATGKADFPMEGNCQVTDVVYKCDITTPLPKKVHLGLAEGEQKSRLYIYIYICLYMFVYIYIHMVFITEGFFEVAIESWPEWDLNPRPLNSVQML